MSRPDPTSPRNKVRQLPRKASYDRDTVTAILRSGLVGCHRGRVLLTKRLQFR